MSKKIDDAVVASVKSVILANFDTIIAAEKDAKNDHCAMQFTRERKHYESDAFVRAFCEKLAIENADSFAFMLRVEQTQKRVAIYAMQKVTRLLRSIANNYNNQYLDKYTRAILANMRKSENAISNYDARASIASDLRVQDSDRFAFRLHCADSTASTQRSSSSIALAALSLAQYSKEDKLVAYSNKLANAKHMRKMLDTFKTDADIDEAVNAEA